MVEQEECQRTLSNYTKLTLTGSQSSIVRPAMVANNFELKHSFIQKVQESIQFNSLSNEDPNSHIGAYLEVCDILKMNGGFQRM